LRVVVLAAVVASGRAVAEVAAAHAIAWWTGQTCVNKAAVVIPEVEERAVRRLGIDEHRYRSVRFYRQPTGAWRRHEPWMSTLVDLNTGQVLAVVEGRDSTTVDAWLSERPLSWHEGIEVVAIDPSAPYRNAIRDHLPEA
jgi:transposase